MATPVLIPEAQGGPATPLQAIGEAVHTCAQHTGAATASEGASVDAGRSKLTITFTIDREGLPHFTDAYLAQLWHIGQANPAPFGDRVACDFAEAVGREIVRRWLASTPPELWHHQGRHVQRAAVLASEGRAA